MIISGILLFHILHRESGTVIAAKIDIFFCLIITSPFVKLSLSELPWLIVLLLEEMEIDL